MGKRNTRDRAPRRFRGPRGSSKKGLIMVHTGAGKGKTTAAFGVALRALGWNFPVAMVQFIKGKWKTGELEAAKKFGDPFKIFSYGEGFTWETGNFKQDVALAQKAWQKCCELLQDPKYPVVIFDEINYVLHYGFLSTRKVLTELRKKPVFKHVILTGNYAPAALCRMADLVTEMKCIKHPYQRGIPAQQGIDY